MCLYSKTNKKKVAMKKIRCYKVLKYDTITKKYLAPNFNDFEYKINEVNQNQLGKLIVSVNADDVYKGDKVRYICNHGLHTYKKIEDAFADYEWATDNAEIELSFPNNTLTFEYKVFECEIPRGSEYLDGAHNHDGTMKGYVSNKLKLVKEVKQPKKK